jgi:hypothetical protein
MLGFARVGHETPVWVLFQHGNKQGKMQFFRGVISELKMKLLVDNDDNDDSGNDGNDASSNNSGRSGSSVDIQHFVAFDDGDTQWYHLAELEDAGLLLWQEPAEKMVMMNNKMKKRNNGNGRGKQKRKSDDIDDETDNDDEYHEDDDGDDEDYEYEIRDGHQNKKRARVVGRDCATNANSNAQQQDQQQQEHQQAATTTQFEALSRTTQQWFQRLGLTNKAYGSQQDAFDIILAHASHYVRPEAFEQVFFLTDFLFPGKNYHHRLYASFTTKPGRPVRDVLVR